MAATWYLCHTKLGTFSFRNSPQNQLAPSPPCRRNVKTQFNFYFLTSSLIRHENGAFRKRSSNWRNLKTPALRWTVDGKHFENVDITITWFFCQSFRLTNSNWPVIVAFSEFFQRNMNGKSALAYVESFLPPVCFSREVGTATRRVISSRPVPSYLVPLFQNESSCKTFHMKMRLICMKKNISPYTFFI